MRGGNISYNIRPNKFVERRLFLELLRFACPGSPDSYVYVSMGGPQLLDLTDLHYEFGWKNLVSLEYDPLVFDRQQFNIRPGCLKCKNISSGEFIDDFDSFEKEFDKHQFVIWLDYADATKRHEQLKEYSTLIGLLNAGDTIKITLNASLETLGGSIRKGETLEQFDTRRLQKLRSSLGEFSPIHLSPECTKHTGFIQTLCNAIDTASTRSIEHRRNISKLPLSIFVYNDGNHSMLTYTIKIINSSELAEAKLFFEKNWNYLPTAIDKFHTLDIPNLSLKERIFIESLLYTKDNSGLIHQEIPFKFHDDDSNSLAILDQYIEHYRRYPGYIPIKI